MAEKLSASRFSGFRHVGLLLSILLLTGCGRATTVVLVKNPDGQVGNVTLETRSGSSSLHLPGSGLRSSSKNARPRPTETLATQEIEHLFAATLAHEPAQPRRFPIHFLPDTSDVEADSMAQLRMAFVTIRSRNSCDVRIIGHSDGSADEAKNRVIADLQTDFIEQALVAREVDGNCLKRHYYGASDPLVRSATPHAHPMNQRVEIEVR